MKRILLAALIVGVWLLGACGSSGNDTYHYVNNEFGYSIDCPADWNIETLGPTRIGIGTAEGGYNQIQIDAAVGASLITSMSDQQAAETCSENVRQAFNALGATDISIPVNKRGTDKWSWELAFTVTYEDTPLQGGEFILETETTTYTIFYLYSAAWPEGMEVIDSFSPIE
jgi:hypothetical protein